MIVFHASLNSLNVQEYFSDCLKQLLASEYYNVFLGPILGDYRIRNIVNNRLMILSRTNIIL